MKFNKAKLQGVGMDGIFLNWVFMEVLEVYKVFEVNWSDFGKLGRNSHKLFH